jgi:tetratricopeptide (TPR) repeat protein
VLSIDPSQVDAIFGLVQLAIGRSDFAEAQTWLSSAPESAARFQLEGELRTAERRFAEAAQAFARAYELAPTSSSAVRASVAAQRAGQPQPEAPLLSWLERSPRDQQVNFALGSFELDRGDYDAAIQRFDLVLTVNPRHAAALNNLAWIYGERGDERALPLALRAREALPRDASIADTLGWLYVRRGEPATGLPFLEEAIRSSPGDSEIRYHWAVALADTGDRVRAERALSALVSGNIDFPSRAQARELLEVLRSGRTP